MSKIRKKTHYSEISVTEWLALYSTMVEIKPILKWFNLFLPYNSKYVQRMLSTRLQGSATSSYYLRYLSKFIYFEIISIYTNQRQCKSQFGMSSLLSQKSWGWLSYFQENEKSSLFFQRLKRGLRGRQSKK